MPGPASTNDLTPVFALLSLIVSTIGTIVVALIAYYMRRLEINTNHKMDMLLKVSIEAAEARGVLAGREDASR